MSLNKAMAIASSGLTAQRTRMEVVSSNLANAKTTRTSEGGPYRRKEPIFVAESFQQAFDDVMGGSLRYVRVSSISEDTAPFLKRYEPGHPDADAEGIVLYPNVDPVREMVDMLSATRSYEANVTLVRNIREMMGSALQILG
jgi:flagellar basal-body rod protein FlgC